MIRETLINRLREHALRDFELAHKVRVIDRAGATRIARRVGSIAGTADLHELDFERVDAAAEGDGVGERCLSESIERAGRPKGRSTSGSVS